VLQWNASNQWKLWKMDIEKKEEMVSKICKPNEL